MKIRVVVELATKSEDGIKILRDMVNDIRSGKLQREAKDTDSVRCKATVEVLEGEE